MSTQLVNNHSCHGARGIVSSHRGRIQVFFRVLHTPKWVVLKGKPIHEWKLPLKQVNITSILHQYAQFKDLFFSNFLGDMSSDRLVPDGRSVASPFISLFMTLTFGTYLPTFLVADTSLWVWKGASALYKVADAPFHSQRDELSPLGLIPRLWYYIIDYFEGDSMLFFLSMVAFLETAVYLRAANPS